MPDNRYLKPTNILNFNHPDIQNLISTRSWQSLPVFERIGAAYNFVRDEIEFGYNSADNITASNVLNDGIGQCNTKANLLMALFRALKIQCRLHGFTIHKSLQRGVVPELIYPITPENIIHTWVEIKYEDKWLNLEGFILDKPFVKRLQQIFGPSGNSLCSFGAGTNKLNNPDIDWCGKDTYIQKTGINNDLGIYDSPDEFYANHAQNFPFWKRWLYTYAIRRWMNFRVRRIRAGYNPKRVEETKIVDIGPQPGS